MAKTKQLMDVRPGDEWRDNDSRMTDTGKRFVVSSVDETHVYGRWRFRSGIWGSALDRKMLRRRFRPNSTGYVLMLRKPVAAKDGQ